MPADQFATPVLAILAYLAAFLTAALLIRFVAPIRRSLEQAKAGRHLAIDGLRGYLAFGVFVHHCVVTWFYLENGRWEVPPSNFYTQLGQSSVALFFMITAFLFWGRLLERGARVMWRELFISRLFRLYPLYLFVVALVVIIVFASTGWAFVEHRSAVFGELAQWVLFATPLGPNINNFNNTWMLVALVTWSLQYEWLFYLALPLAGFVFARSGKLPAALVSICALAALIWAHQGPTYFHLEILATFLGGIVAAYWVRQPVSQALTHSRLAGVIALLCLFVVMFFTPTAYDVLPLLLLSVFFIVVASGNELFGALRFRVARWLGEVSYSTYLLHGLLVWLVFQRLFPSSFGLAPREAVFMLAVPIAGILLVVLSSITYLWIERPGIAIGKRLAGSLAHFRELEPQKSGEEEAKALS